MVDEEPVDSMEVPVLWLGVEDLPVLSANQFIGQVDGDVAHVVIGVVTPPMLLGSPKEQRQAAERLGYVPIHPITRLALTRRRLEEFRDVLNATIENHDRLARGGQP